MMVFPRKSARPGDWVCHTCGNNNYSFRTNCNKCTIPKPQELSFGPLDPTTVPPNVRPGDWVCGQCSNINYASRSICNKCNQPRPDGAAVMGPPPLQPLPGVQLDYRAKPGDWVCSSCKNVCYQWRDSCAKCHAPRAPDARVIAPQPGVPAPLHATERPPNIAVRPGDWVCPFCCNVNYSWRMDCNQCSKVRPVYAPRVPAAAPVPAAAGRGVPNQQLRSRAPRPAAPVAPGIVSASIVQPGGPKWREGDWGCVCGNHNYQFREKCFKCGLPKPGTSTGGGSKVEIRLGDWACVTCGNHNFSFRDRCNKCGTPGGAAARPRSRSRSPLR